MTLFAVPDAPAWWWWHHGPDISLELSGSNFTTSSADGTPTPLGEVSTSLQSGIGKGKSGRPIFSAQTIINEPGQDERCGPLPGAPLSTTTVLTYKDGSILSLVTDSEKSFYCFQPTDFDTQGVPITGIFSVEFEGTVSGGTGRFKRATGTWVGSAETEGARVTASLEVDLD